jgi:hypothetical protein
MPIEEQQTPQIRKIYDIAREPHPAYSNFIIQDTWAFAQKIAAPEDSGGIKKETVIVTEKIGLGYIFNINTKKISRVLAKTMQK